MSMLFVVEPNKRGSEHLSFNAAMLGILVRAAHEECKEVLLVCHRSHYDQLLTLLPEQVAVKWRDIPVVSGLSRSFFRKFVTEFVVILRVLLEARRKRADVLLLSVFPNALAGLLLFKRLLKNVRLHVVLHGELESLIIPEKRHIHREGFWVKLMALKLFDGSWPRLYVLGQGLKHRLLEYFPAHDQLNQLHVIEHPYMFTDELPDPPRRCGAFKIGFVGVGRMVKGIDAFFRLAEALSDCIDSGALELVVVGGIEPGIKEAVPQGVHVLADQPAGLDAGMFSQAIAELDCAVFLYRQNYVFTASGAVFDVLNQGVDIIALENHYLRDLSRCDSEGGVRFFADVHQVEEEIRRQLKSGRPRERRTYSQIKRHHWAGAQAVIAAEVLGT